MLEVSTNGGMSRTVASLKTRCVALKRKIHRYHVLGRRGFSKKAWSRPTVVRAATYVCEVTGYSDTSLAQLRPSTLKTIATQTAGGASTPDGWRGTVWQIPLILRL